MNTISTHLILMCRTGYQILRLPSWITRTIDPTLGLERSVDILWLGYIMMPIHSTPTPTLTLNIYKQGIDLNLPRTGC